MPIRRIAFGMTLAALLAAGPARADERVECAHAYEQTQRLQQKHELLGALDAADRCSRATCPSILQQDCAKWVFEIRAKLASLTLHVRSKDGCAGDGASVSISGEHRAVESGRRESVLAPGSHEIRVTDSVSGMTKTDTIDFAEGERRDLDFDFAPAGAVCGEAAPSSTTKRQIPPSTFIIGGIGGALLLAGGTIGIVGAVKRGDLACKGHCSESEVDGVRVYFTTGDILGAFGLLAVGTAAAIYFLSAPPSSSKATLAHPFRVTF